MKMKVGADLDIDGVRHAITAMSATTVALRESDSGFTKEILISDLVRLPDVRATVSRAGTDPEVDLAVFQHLDDGSRNDVEFWLRHLRELDRAIEVAAAASLAPTEPIRKKLAELAGLGRPVTERTLRRKRRAFRESGIAGLIDQRQHRTAGERRRVDTRVAAALAEVMDAQTNASTGTRTRLVNLTRQLLTERFGAGTVTLPACRPYDVPSHRRS